MVRAGDDTRIVDSFDLSPTTTSPALGCTETANYEQPEDISGRIQNVLGVSYINVKPNLEYKSLYASRPGVLI